MDARGAEVRPRARAVARANEGLLSFCAAGMDGTPMIVHGRVSVEIAEMYQAPCLAEANLCSACN